MSDSYTTPFNVWQRIGREKQHRETRNQLLENDTVEVQKHVIPETVKITHSGGELDEQDFTVDERFNEIVYEGSETIENVRINYFSAPVSNERADRAIDQAESHVDSHLDTTFGGLQRVKEEIYSTDGTAATELMLQKQPVRDVETVWINSKASESDPAEWVELTEGEDWIQTGETGFKLTENIDSTSSIDGITFDFDDNKRLSRSQQQIRVTYTYGYEDVPGDIENLAEILLVTQEGLNTVFGSMVDGRDNFDPATINSYERIRERIMGEWDREFYNNFTTVVEPGEVEDV